MSFKVVKAGLSQGRRAVRVAGSWLTMSKQFALQLWNPQLLNAQTQGTQGISKEHQTVLKILYSLENTAFSTVCSAPPSFNPLTLPRPRQHRHVHRHSWKAEGRFHRPLFHPLREAGGSRALAGTQQQGALPPCPQCSPNHSAKFGPWSRRWPLVAGDIPGDTQGLSCSPTQGFGVPHVIIETWGCPRPETQLRTWEIR